MLPYYYSVSEYLKKTYGHKLYKLSLSGGMTCPNRDGLIDTRGCIFCSSQGSGDFAVTDIDKAKSVVADKYSGNEYIAYFQSFTNTYADADYLRKLFTPVIMRDDIRILSIATRPDCLGSDIIELLSELNSIKPVWVELGLQTINEDTARYIRRGYKLSVYDEAAHNLNQAGIQFITHMIVGLPGDTTEDTVATARYIADSKASGIKIALLHVLKDTDLYADYCAGRFSTMTMEEYFQIIGQILAIMPKDMVIHRLTGDGPKNTLAAPLWTADKKRVLNALSHYLKDNNIYQGKDYEHRL
ncbi:MAG: TIGR01212 family radical SAM protein [Clostridia bacterium]|nr:TIGR01212 family radical SAM protein [Clostridia bacterium]